MPWNRTPTLHRSPWPIRRIAAARRPLLFVGLGARELEAERLLVGVAERLGAPVVVTPKAKGHFPADHPLFAGVHPAYQSEPVKELLRRADVVVGIGLDPVEMLRPWPFEAPVVAFGPIPASAYFPDCLDVRVTSYPALAGALEASTRAEAGPPTSPPRRGWRFAASSTRVGAGSVRAASRPRTCWIASAGSFGATR